MTEELVAQPILEMKHIAREINAMLGTKYRVSVDGKTRIDSDDRIDVLLYAERIPFAVTGIGSESLKIGLEIYADAKNAEVREAVLKDLNTLIGHRSGMISAEDKTYRYAMFLQFSRTLGAPVHDMGVKKHLLSINGDMLVSEIVTGALISNDIVTRVYLGDPVRPDTIGGAIPVLSILYESGSAVDSYQKYGNALLNVQEKAIFSEITLTALILNRTIDMELETAILNAQKGIEVEVYLLRERPVFDGTVRETRKKCVLLGGSVTEQAGAYAQYSIKLREVF